MKRWLNALWKWLTLECYPHARHDWVNLTTRHRTCARCHTSQFLASHRCDPADGHPHSESWS